MKGQNGKTWIHKPLCWTTSIATSFPFSSNSCTPKECRSFVLNFQQSRQPRRGNSLVHLSFIWFHNEELKSIQDIQSSRVHKSALSIQQQSKTVQVCSPKRRIFFALAVPHMVIQCLNVPIQVLKEKCYHNKNTASCFLKTNSTNKAKTDWYFKKFQAISCMDCIDLNCK